MCLLMLIVYIIVSHKLVNLMCAYNVLHSGFVGEEYRGGLKVNVVPIIWTNLMCEGNEESNQITNCSYDELDENHNCIQDDNIIVSCYCKLVNVYNSLKEYFLSLFSSTAM